MSDRDPQQEAGVRSTHTNICRVLAEYCRQAPCREKGGICHKPRGECLASYVRKFPEKPSDPIEVCCLTEEEIHAVTLSQKRRPVLLNKVPGRLLGGLGPAVWTKQTSV